MSIDPKGNIQLFRSFLDILFWVNIIIGKMNESFWPKCSEWVMASTPILHWLLGTKKKSTQKNQTPQRHF